MIAIRKDAYHLLHQGILALGRAERQGIRIDLDYCYQTNEELTQQIKDLETKLYATKFYRRGVHSIGERTPNINSDAQLGNYLYRVLKKKPSKTTPSGQGSTDEESLSALKIPELDYILKIRKLMKLRDTYFAQFIREQVDGFIHPFFNLHIAQTFRSSSNSPNFQNIPKRDKEAQKIVRRALYPRKGYQLLEVDYSGIEVRISACYHKDPKMIEYIEDLSTDMHGDMAVQIFGLDELDKEIEGHSYLRSASKNGFVFPQFYGDYYGNNAIDLAIKWGELSEGKWKTGQGVKVGHVHLSDLLLENGIGSLNQFTEHLKKIEKHFWGSRFKVYDKWKKKWYSEYLKNGYIDMYTGFRCNGPMTRNEVCNYPIQGTAFHCLLWSFIQMDNWLKTNKMKTRLIGQIHDAIVLDVHPAELKKVTKMLKKIMVDRLMKEFPWIIVPMAVEMDLGGIDESWNELQPYAA